MVPAYPSLFVHLGSDGPHMPEFTRSDGTAIAIRNTVEIASYPYSLVRVDLDISEGDIIVRLEHDGLPVATFVASPTYQPRTRKVELRPTGTLRIESDAVEFAVYGRGPEEVVPNEGTLRLELGKRQRVIALYSSGVAEEIYDDIPREVPERTNPRPVPQIHLAGMDLPALPATILLLLVLGAVGVLAARTD